MALELLRQEKSMVSAASTYRHYPNVDQAQREFNRLSIEQRSKLESEAVNKYGGEDLSNIADQKKSSNAFRTTTAVVTIAICIEGDQTKLPIIKSRQDVVTALSRMASDVPVEECLLSAEVLWAPEGQDTLSKEDLIADFPNLFPL